MKVENRPSFCFADRFSRQEILQDPQRAEQFRDQFVASEAGYFQLCHDPSTGLVYDGVDLDARTGRVEKMRNWSAPSKECLDLGVLLKSLTGNAEAQRLVAPGKALELLEKKLDSYQDFQGENPGYAGFLPWYYIRNGGIEATPDWYGKIPGLDNGEWMWTMLLTEKVLRDGGHTQLAERYAAYNQGLIDNVTRVFYDPQGVACRGDVRIHDPKDPNTGYEALNPGSFMTGEHGVHEGCMLIHFLTLFGKDLPPGAAERIWDDIEMVRVETPAATTWQGFWGSAHESWAWLFLPFRDHAGYRDLHRLREQVRTQNAVERGYPGLATSTNGPRGGYLSAAGIEGVGSQPVTANDTFAVYGVFPLMLEYAQHVGPGNLALAWLHNMLSAPRMQGPLGAGESGTNDGQAFSAMKTTDGTHPTLLGMMGGLEKEMADLLREKGKYDDFMQRIDQEYREAFARPLHDRLPALAPQARVPRQLLGDYEVA